jgi:hypothetical protein
MKIRMIHSWIKNEVKWICAKLEETASVQTFFFVNPKNNEKNYMDKDYSENQVVEMHYVEHFIMSLIINKLIQHLLKPCNVFFIITVQFWI